MSTVAKPVDHITPDLIRLSEAMVHTMIEENGIGLAAPQVGKSLRMIVVMTPERASGSLTLVNPVITSSSEATVFMSEGCLSLPGVYQKIERPAEITVTFRTIDNQVRTESFDGIVARCIQHEIDHLNGITLADSMSAFKRSRLLKRGKRWNIQ